MQSGDGTIEGSGGEDSIRERQRRRRETTRHRLGIEAVLAAGAAQDDLEDDDESQEDDGDVAATAAPPARVYVVFRGAKWTDPDGALRESDSIAGIYGTEAAAHRAAAALTRESPDAMDAWYQPYPVQE